MRLSECAAHDEFDRHIIIGACNPYFALQLFKNAPNIGLLMPCNIVIYEMNSVDCKVMVKDHARIMDMISSPTAIETSINIKCLMEEIVEELNKQGHFPFGKCPCFLKRE